MQCPGCQHENRPQAKFCEECATALNARTASGPYTSSLGEITAALSEARAQQAATAEILRVISNSPTDLQPVFDTIVESVVQLCGGVSAFVYRFDGDLIHLSAHHHTVTSRARDVFERRYPAPPSRISMIAQAILDRTIIHVHDFENDTDVSPASREMAQAAGHRSTLAVPMLRHGSPIGAIAVGRRGPHGEPRPFSDGEIELLKTFADQAVIAIENVRLFTELEVRNRELTAALEQQAATSEILRVISSSPTNLQPVLDTVVASAARYCGAYDATMLHLDGGSLKLAAHHGPIPIPVGRPIPVVQGTTSGRAVLERRAVHVIDIQAEAEGFPESRAFAKELGYRTQLSVPLLREEAAIGTIVLRRIETSPFTDKQIALLQTFADQAVIAIENVRLFKELQARNRDLTDSLKRETATGEILRVISSSPTDIQPVLVAILDSGRRLCDAAFGAIFRFEDGVFVNAASTTVTSEFGAWLQKTPIQPGPGTPLRRIGMERHSVQVADILSDPEFAPPAEYRREGMRTALAVPMLKDGVLLGALTFHRRIVKPFTDQEIGLLETFAAQAVIAIENVRLFKELEEKNLALTRAHTQVSEALEQQTATGEILRAITHAPTDTQPVFDTIVRSAATLCRAAVTAVFLSDGQMVFVPANYGSSPEALGAVRARFPRPLDMESSGGIAILTRSVVHVPDIEEPSVGELVRQNGRRLGFRSLITVPMLRDDAVVGAIGVYRREPGRFSDAEVALLQTFAAQAVIAIENVRLFTELQENNHALTEAHAQVTEALEQQTATSDILRVISSSPTDVQPVFDTVAASAARLCDAYDAAIHRLDGDVLRLVAHEGPIDPDVVLPLGEGTLAGHVVRLRQVMQVADMQAETEQYPISSGSARRRGFRTILSVPLMRGGEAIGIITIRRTEVRPFTDTQIALLQTFADQAVIAIENVRLFTELQQKNQALTEAHAQVTETLEQQTATAEILRVISSSPTDVQPVFDVIVEQACRLCDAVVANVVRIDGDLMHNMAAFGFTPEAQAVVRRSFPMRPSRATMSGRAILERAVVVSEDTSIDEVGMTSQEISRSLGGRAMVSVPMLRDGIAVGAITLARRERGRFPERQLNLLRSFAHQAVIAIENARLFSELQASNRDLTTALDQQTATSDILRVISQSQTDVQPVFDAIVTSAVRLLRAHSGSLTRLVGDQIELAALTSTDNAGDANLRETFPRSLHSAGSSIAHAIRDRAPLNVTDTEVDPRRPEAFRAMARARGYRSQVVVPLLRHGEAIGAIAVTRREPGGFTDDEIALLKTFTDQAVIAIENARLLTELQARTQELSRSVSELRALGEVGQTISSTLDLKTVLTTIVSRAVQLSGLDGGVVFEYDEGTEEFVHRAATETGGALAEARRTTRVRRGEGVVGQTAISLEPAQVPDITVPGAYDSRLRGNLIESGVRAILAVPMVREGQLIGCLVVSRNRPGDFPAETIELLKTFATQSALAIQNARLFHEIEDKSRQLEVASQHKSEFLANMSHELRTPLNAIIGFSEVLMQRMFGELNLKQEEYLRDIYDSGRHLLSLINDILDLSKIEAGRMELERTDFDLPTAIDSALTLVRERATRRGIALQKTFDERVGQVQADERKVRQVVLNLLSNAVKFTPEGGRIEVRAVPVDGSIEVSVTDTGVGIAPEDQAAMFEEFRQVGATAAKTAKGPGSGSPSAGSSWSCTAARSGSRALWGPGRPSPSRSR